MKLLIDLKRELVEEKLEKLYIFTGKEHTIRRIYLEKIFSLKGNHKYCESVSNIFQELSKKSLIPMDYVYYCYNDEDFLKQKKETMEKLTELLKKSNSIVVLVFEDIDTTSTIYKTFSDNFTSFDFVQDEIARKYVKKELDCPNYIAHEIAYNCNNDYGKILFECDKIKNFKYDSRFMNESQQMRSEKDHTIDAFEYLVMSKMLFEKREAPTPEEVSEAFIKRDKKKFTEYHYVFKYLELDILYYLPDIYDTVNIMLMCKMYGKWDGSSKAYNAGLYWGRVKKIREYVTPYSVDDLLNILEVLQRLDSDIRLGNIQRDLGFDYLLGVIL